MPWSSSHFSPIWCLLWTLKWCLWTVWAWYCALHCCHIVNRFDKCMDVKMFLIKWTVCVLCFLDYFCMVQLTTQFKISFSSYWYTVLCVYIYKRRICKTLLDMDCLMKMQLLHTHCKNLVPHILCIYFVSGVSWLKTDVLYMPFSRDQTEEAGWWEGEFAWTGKFHLYPQI